METEIILKKQLDYFTSNQEELVKKYSGKFLVIEDEKVQGVYNSETEAYTDAINKFEEGTFLIQYCLSGEGVYTQSFLSRVRV